MTGPLAWLIAAIAVVLAASTAQAQVRPAPRPAPPSGPSIRGFADAGLLTFTAKESFEAILGSRSGPVFGVGGEVVLRRFFGSARLSWFQQTGERVFVFDDEVFPLGIDTEIRIMPIEVTGGYRFADLTATVVPYAGGGIGWHRFEETSEFATDDENVSETHQGYHILGGVDVRLARLVRVGGEVQWTTVPDAIGQDPNSVSAAFDEDDLGGVALRVKFTVGR